MGETSTNREDLACGRPDCLVSVGAARYRDLNPDAPAKDVVVTCFPPATEVLVARSIKGVFS